MSLPSTDLTNLEYVFPGPSLPLPLPLPGTLCRVHRVPAADTGADMGAKTFTHSSASHSQEMLEKLNALRSDGHLCDVTIRVQDKLFLAHKVVLACCSDFFRSKLLGRPEDEQHAESVLDLNHVTVSGFAPLLEYAYTSTLSISTENIIDVLAAASYMQMFAVASTCSEFMKSSILWSPGSSTTSTGSSSTNQNPINTSTSSSIGGSVATVVGVATESSASHLMPLLDGAVSPVSSECSVLDRNLPVCRESRRKRKSLVTSVVSMASVSPESHGVLAAPPVTVVAPASSPRAANPSPPFSDGAAQPVESSLAFPWTFPFGMDRRFHADKVKLPESPRCLEAGATHVVVRSDYLSCDGPKGAPLSSSPRLPAGEEEEDDVRVKVERLSDEEAQEPSSLPVSASQSSVSDQQTVPGSEQVQEELLISPQSSSIGRVVGLTGSAGYGG